MTAAVRQARMRRRRRLGLARYSIELPELAIVEMLISLGALPMEQSEDPAAISRALETIILRKILSRRDFQTPSTGAMSLARNGAVERGEMRLRLMKSETDCDTGALPSPSPADIASRVHLPARLQLARREWSELRRRHAALTTQLRELIAGDEHPEGDAARRREISRIDAEITMLVGQIQAAGAAVKEATPPFARAIAEALDPMRREAAADALSAAERLAAALHRLADIDRELVPLDARLAWHLRPLHPALAPLRRRINGLLS